MIVKKQDGRLEEFDANKILASIKKASLAVEVKDDDIQRKTLEIQGIKRQLIEAGYDPDDAAEQAESQYEGYVENGIYTEYNEDEAREVLAMVLEGLEGLGLDEEDKIETEVIQNFVEKALISSNHIKTAKEYMMKRANRARIREINSSLMRSFEELTFGRSEDVETKRENANIDGDSSMGTMLKYGSEGAKKFNLLYVVPPDASEAHSNGDIHIHDLDFYSLTETCVSKHMEIEIARVDDTGIEWESITISKFLDRFLEHLPEDTVYEFKSGEEYYISSSNLTGTDAVRIINCVRHPIRNKKMLRITCNRGAIDVTSDHRVSITKRDILNTDDLDTYYKLIDSYGGEWFEDIRACELKIGDQLVHTCNLDGPDIGLDITSIEEIPYDGYVYDIETEDNHFTINGFVVHNCCQIDLEKLFKNGFNTGHGFLREPGEIRSYAALACIAIQSNQNDQHKRVA